MTGSVLAFFGVAFIVIATPGQDTALTVRNTLIGGRRAGFSTAVKGRRIAGPYAAYGRPTIL